MRFLSRPVVGSFSRLSLVGALLLGMSFTTVSLASGSNFKALVDRVAPTVSKQISKVAIGGKVAVTGMCFAALCALNFASPATVEAASLNDLSTNSELLQGRGHSSIFSSSKEAGSEKSMDERAFLGSWWAAKGVYNDYGGSLGVVRFGFNGDHPNFSVYMTNAFRYHPDDIKDIDNAPIKMRTYAGVNGLVVKKGEGDVSLGYNNTNAFISDRLVIRSLQNYLLHYQKGPIQVAAVGHEYFDGYVEDLEDADELRGHFVSLYRGSIKHAHETMDGVEVSFKLNSALGLGEIGDVELGQVWHADLTDWADGHDLHHTLIHRGGAGIGLSMSEGRVTLGLGGSYTNTIGGQISMPGENGDFTIGESIISASFGIDLLPEHGISLEGAYEWYRQTVDAEMGGRELSDVNDGTWGLFKLKRKF